MSDIQQPPDWATHQVRPIVGLSDDPSTCICWDCRAWRELVRLREQADALATAHQRVRSIILSVENRCMAADGPVSRTLEEMTEDELRAIWQASDAALRAYQEATP